MKENIKILILITPLCIIILKSYQNAERRRERNYFFDKEFSLLYHFFDIANETE